MSRLRGILTAISCGFELLLGSPPSCLKIAFARPKSTSSCGRCCSSTTRTRRTRCCSTCARFARFRTWLSALQVARMLSAGEHYSAIQDTRCVGDNDLAREQVAELRRRRLRADSRQARREPRRLGTRSCPSSTCTLTPNTRCSTARRGSRQLVAAGRRRSRCPRSPSPTTATCTARSTSTRPPTKAGVKPIIGCEVYFTPDMRGKREAASPTSTTCCFSPRTTRATAT